MAMRAEFYYVLCANPLILGSTGAPPQNGKLNRPGLPEGSLPYTLLQHFSRHVGTEKMMAEIKVAQENCMEIGLDYRAMVSSSEEDQFRESYKVTGSHVGHNIHVNEHQMKPVNCEKKFDAIYVAQLKKFKRLELASQINKLLVISYGGDVHEFCPSLSHCEYNPDFLDLPEVAENINLAHCGLCLSAIEGQMNASVEYLSCGLPVVTTPSIGGRDEYFDRLNSITVDPDSKLIAEAVQEWKRRKIDPQLIRNDIIGKIKIVRETYCNYISQIIKNRTGETVSSDWLTTLYYGSERGMHSREVLPMDIGDPAIMSQFAVELPYHLPLRKPGVKLNVVGDEYILTLSDGRTLPCNYSGAVIWELCDSNTSIANIVDIVISEFSAPSNSARNEVLATLKLLSYAGAISNNST